MAKKTSTVKFDSATEITNRIIEMLEKVYKFQQPWVTVGGNAMSPINARTRKAYTGINVMLLWSAADTHGFTSGEWGTAKMWNEMGYRIKEDEFKKWTQVFFWKKLSGKKDDTGESDGSDEGKASRGAMICWLYRVYAAEQIEGYEPKQKPLPSEAERIDAAEAFFSATGIPCAHGGNRAFYRPATDSVTLPAPEQFRATEHSTATQNYYSTKAHEFGHATGHELRCKRDLTGRFGSESYAMEELVAELTAAFTMAHLGLSAIPRQDHINYLASWLKVLKNDKHAIFTASRHAQQALAWMMEQQPDTELIHDDDTDEAIAA